MAFQPRLTTRKDFKKGTLYTGALLGSLDPGMIATDVFGDKLHYGSLFAYLYRRFGPPNIDGDDHKEICAYNLTTPMKDVFLHVKIGAQTDTRLQFGYLLSQKIDSAIWKMKQAPATKWRNAYFAWLKDNGIDQTGTSSEQRLQLAARFLHDTGHAMPPTAHAPLKKGSLGWRAERALRQTMIALKRPVLVRDVPITAAGKDNPTGRLVRRSKSAGYGIPTEFFAEPIEFGHFVGDLTKLGNGDVGKGIKKARKIIQEAA